MNWRPDLIVQMANKLLDVSPKSTVDALTIAHLEKMKLLLELNEMCAAATGRVFVAHDAKDPRCPKPDPDTYVVAEMDDGSHELVGWDAAWFAITGAADVNERIRYVLDLPLVGEVKGGG